MRKLRLAAAVSLVLASPGAFALGLGDIEMRSALNQPMNAEIRLTSVKPGELDGMIVTLASADAFSRAGIERSQSLQDLRFSVDDSGPAPVIRISSMGPVIEPFLNFLLEVDWPQGRMVREYTVLLDPPVFLSHGATSSGSSDTPALTNSSDNALAAPAPIDRRVENAAEVDFDVEVIGGGEVANSVGGSEPATIDVQASTPLVPADGEVISLTDIEAPNPAAAQSAGDFEFAVEIAGSNDEVGNEVGGSAEIIRTAEAEADAFEVEIIGGDELGGGDGVEISLDDFDVAASDAPAAGAEVTVQTGDTLYEIAQRAAGDQVSVEQMMLALLNANESAFIEGNINLVRAGSILRIPDAPQAQSLSQSQALAEVASQSQLWQEYRDNLRANQGTSIASAPEQAEQPAESTEPATEDLGQVVVEDTVEQAAEQAAADVESAAQDGELLSADARAILEQAREEIQQRDELRIVGEDTSTDAVADAGEGSEGEAVADVDRRLQLAREELSSARLESGDLVEQATELEATTENLDALVTLRQNEIAALEQQLTDARENAENAASGLAGQASNAVEGAADAVAEVGDSVADAADTTTDAASTAATDAVAAVTDSSDNEAQEGQNFFQALLADPRKMAIAGVGGLALLGALGTLLFGRRRSDDDLLDDVDDRVRDGDPDVSGDKIDRAVMAADQTGDKVSDTGASMAAGAGAAVAGAAAVGRLAGEDEDTREAYEAMIAGSSDEDDDDIDKDDTMSEADVYLAYGLHGQAEELLVAASEREPDNHLFPRKLLDTYNAQGNGEAFARTAADYHSRFGGDAAPDWATISAMGHELRPQDEMFSSSAAAVAAVGSGQVGGTRLDASDFTDAGADNPVSSSVTRDFGAAEEPLDFDNDDVSGMLDQSVDPAFAFDEADLEATGDFSQIADEVAAENDVGTIEFPDLDDVTTDITAGASELESFDLAVGATAANEKMSDATATAADLTLDLDQLSEDISLDSTELLDATDLGSVDGLEIPDLTADNELLSGNLDGPAGGADEMDSMLDLAKAYIDMGDKDSASNALDQIVKSGSPDQVSEAETLLRKIS